MPIPNADSAYVPEEKLRDYLLNEQHPIGWGKAKWFLSLGYNVADLGRLEQALLDVARTCEHYAESTQRFGTKYVASAKITAPSAAEVNVTTVWIVEPPDTRPRLVTAYPGEKP